jgi:hypothetical protein
MYRITLILSLTLSLFVACSKEEKSEPAPAKEAVAKEPPATEAPAKPAAGEAQPAPAPAPAPGSSADALAEFGKECCCRWKDETGKEMFEVKGTTDCVDQIRGACDNVDTCSD